MKKVAFWGKVTQGEVFASKSCCGEAGVLELSVLRSNARKSQAKRSWASQEDKYSMVWWMVSLSWLHGLMSGKLTRVKCKQDVAS